MEFIFHLGAHATDGDQLIRSLAKNREMLGRIGTRVPPPRRYRARLRSAIAPRSDTPAPALGEIVEAPDDDLRRVILSNPNFLSVPARIFDDGAIYAKAARRAAALDALFPGAGSIFAIALRNVATFVPTLLARMPDTTPAAFLRDADPLSLKWSETIARLRAGAPDATIVVWCNEDTPLIWPDVLAALGGFDPATIPAGGLDVVEGIIRPEGAARLRTYLEAHPPVDPAQRHRTLATFVETFAIEDEIEEEIDLPGWSDALVDALTEAYEADCARIAAMDNVVFIAP